VKFGLVGTGFWARTAHATGIRATDGAELVGVYGRDPQKAAAIAGEFGAAAYDDYDDMLAAVDAVAFAVPPDVQVEHAVRAARRGRHLLLDKPVATAVGPARELAEAVEEAGVSSVVFFTARFMPELREWAAQMRSSGPWRGAAVVWLAAALAPGSPFDTPWRHEKGGLWDVGPHVVAALTDTLGPVTAVLAAARGQGDVAHLVFAHESGATSTATVTIAASPEVARADVTAWSDHDTATMPRSKQSADVSLSIAARELMQCAATGTRHPVDVAFGCRVVELLAAAEALMDAAGSPTHGRSGQ
jgi:predicted dehydrogenase